MPYPPAEDCRDRRGAVWSVAAARHAAGWLVRGTHRFGRLEIAGPTGAAAWWYALLLAEAMLLGPDGKG